MLMTLYGCDMIAIIVVWPGSAKSYIFPILYIFSHNWKRTNKEIWEYITMPLKTISVQTLLKQNSKNCSAKAT